MAEIKVNKWLILSEDELGAGRREAGKSVLLTTQGKVELLIKTI